MAGAAAAAVLAALAGDAPVLLGDPLWASLAALDAPLSRLDPAELERAVRPATASLVYNNARTLNCQRLVYAVAEALRRARGGGAGAGAAANAAALLRLVLKDLAQQLNAAQLLSLVELPPGHAAADEFPELGGGPLVAALVSAALGALDGRPEAAAGAGGYLLQLEAAHLLLAAASTQLYAPPGDAAAPGGHPFLVAALRLPPGEAAAATEAMLRLFAAAPPPPLALRLPGDARAALRAAGRAAAGVLKLPLSAAAALTRPLRGAPPPAPPAGAASPLGDAALLLLLVLAFQAPPPAPGAGDNPFMAALRALRDPDHDDAAAAGAAELGAGAGAGAPAVSYAAVYAALARALAARAARAAGPRGAAAARCEPPCLLLYALVHGCAHFREYALARSDPDALLLPLLGALADGAGAGAPPGGLYVLLVLLLMLSQDAAFAAGVHRVPVPAAAASAAYRDRALGGTTLGSLLVAGLLRAAHANLAAARDAFLHTNALAALANLAPHVTGLSAHACGRLVSLFDLLARRRGALAAAAGLPPGADPDDDGVVAAAAAAAGAGAGAATDGTPAAAARARRALEAQLYGDFMRIVLEVINAVLASNLAGNPDLVYALLHRREVLEPYRSAPRYAELMANIFAVADYFGRRVEDALAAAGAGAGADAALAAVRAAARGWRRDRLRPTPELRFSYEEEAEPWAFFVPAAWAAAVAGTAAAMAWEPGAVALVAPAALRAALDAHGGAGGGAGGGGAPAAAAAPAASGAWDASAAAAGGAAGEAGAASPLADTV